MRNIVNVKFIGSYGLSLCMPVNIAGEQYSHVHEVLSAPANKSCYHPQALFPHQKVIVFIRFRMRNPKFRVTTMVGIFTWVAPTISGQISRLCILIILRVKEYPDNRKLARTLLYFTSLISFFYVHTPSLTHKYRSRFTTQGFQDWIS